MRRLRGWIRDHGRWPVAVIALLVAAPALPHCPAPAGPEFAAASGVPAIAGDAAIGSRVREGVARVSAPADDCALLGAPPRATPEPLPQPRRALWHGRVPADLASGEFLAATRAWRGIDGPRAVRAGGDGAGTWLRTQRLRI